MEVIVKGKLMEVISKEYDYNGQKGISHKACVYFDSQLYNVVIGADRVKEFKDLIGQNVELDCKIYVKGSYNLKLNE